jgi:hydroxymethylglutaryl-CoA lyase
MSLSRLDKQPGPGAPAAAVTVVEVSPRDGLQNDPSDLPTAAKAELIARVAAAGIRRIEATSFVSPTAVPKMADAEDLVAELHLRGGLEAVSVIGLVVNQRGVARAAAAGVDVGPSTALRAHFHNTRNTGMANVIAAVGAGVTALDASLGGIGGCPFAPAATGNIATEDLAYLLERSRVATGLSLTRLIASASWLSEELGHPIPGMLSKAGVFPPKR